MVSHKPYLFPNEITRFTTMTVIAKWLPQKYTDSTSLTATFSCFCHLLRFQLQEQTAEEWAGKAKHYWDRKEAGDGWRQFFLRPRWKSHLTGKNLGLWALPCKGGICARNMEKQQFQIVKSTDHNWVVQGGIWPTDVFYLGYINVL